MTKQRRRIWPTTSYEILKSAHRLKDDKAFTDSCGGIADNAFKSHLRSKRSHGISESGYTGVYWDTPESEVIHREELQLLRRELALLSSQYRVSHGRLLYPQQSCAEIAHDLRISVEMVKYYLFKTRKILKEGVEMTREFGEKSYHPGTFQMDFLGRRATIPATGRCSKESCPATSSWPPTTRR